MTHARDAHKKTAMLRKDIAVCTSSAQRARKGRTPQRQSLSFVTFVPLIDTSPIRPALVSTMT